MSHYSEDERSVRVDFWKPSGKWYTTEAVLWIGSGDDMLHDEFRASLAAHLGPRLQGMRATCLEPYHPHSHPVSVVIEEGVA